MKKFYRENIFFLFFISSFSINLVYGYSALSDRDSLPPITTSITHEINKGYIFISNIVFNPNLSNIPYLLILNNYGQPVFYRKMPSQCFDFKYQQNLFTY